MATDASAKEFLENLKELEDYIEELRGSERRVELKPDEKSKNIEIDFKEFSVPLDKSGEIRIKKLPRKPEELTFSEMEQKSIGNYAAFEFELWYGEVNHSDLWEKYNKPFQIPMCITIPIPSEITSKNTIVVYHVINQQLEEVAYWKTGKDKISFMADSFSSYIITDKAKKTEDDREEDSEEESSEEDSDRIGRIQTIGNEKFYIKADGSIVKNEWILYQNHWYYAGANGMLKTGWLQTSDGKWYYLSKDCTMKTGWEYVNGKWYYLEDTNGDMLEGWKYTGGKWYYLNLVSGDMAVGWKQVNGKWYYLEDKNGDMLEGWKYTNGKWYYLNPISGDMAVGWKQINGKWYYLNPINGDMAVGWKQIGDKWYYLDLEGDCLLNTITPDGYFVDESGAWIH